MQPRYCLALVGAATLLFAAHSHAQNPKQPSPQGPVERLSSWRERIVLNGLWRFMPATGPTASAPDNDWGLLAVPGTWQRSGWQHGMASIPEFPVQGTGPQWKELGRSLGRAWYEREIEIPESWADRAVVLQFRRVSTEATVFVNGKKCGDVPWPYGEVEITSAVTPGQKATVRVLVVATADPGESIVWMGTTPGQNFTVKSELSRSGLIGEVLLLSRPAGAHITDVFVQPSVRKKEVILDIEIAGVQEAGEVAFTARMLDANGVEAKKSAYAAPVKVAALQKVRLTVPWEDPKLWDLAQPNLYTLQLTAMGPGLDDEYPQRFGFREFWIEGRNFVLNGTPIRLRPALPDEPFALAEIDGVIDGMRSRGFNVSQMWPTDHDKRGNAFQHRELFAQRADEKGWLVIGSLLSLAPYIVDTKYKFIWNAERRDTWAKRMEADLRRYRNSPSIIIWGTTANFFNAASDQDPRHIGRTGFLSTDDRDPKVAAGREGLSLIKKADPTRPVFTHAGNRMGDVYTLNHYLNMLPLQEREEHLSNYSKTGELPAMSVEFGNLLSCDVFRGRNPFQENIRTEPWMTEFAASYLGSRAYLEESPAYRRELRAKYEGGQKWGNWQNNFQLLNAPTFMELNSLMIRNTWRSWRTWGYSGGMLPWDMSATLFALRQAQTEPAPQFQPGQRGSSPAEFKKSMLHYLQPEGGYTPNLSGLTLFSVNAATLAYIAGPQDDFTDKRHAYWAGERLVKSAVVINDEREARPYRLRWSAEVGGKPAGAGKLEGIVEPAQTLLLPLEVALPKSTTGKLDGTLRIEGTIGENSHTDSFAFRLFPVAKPMPATRSKIFVWDPLGTSSELLRSQGLVFTSLNDALPDPATSVLIIGRQAFSTGEALPGEDPQKPGSALREFTERGGRVLVLAQSPEWFRDQLGLRVCRVVSRRVFPVSAEHPVVKGLDELDLRDWTGSGTLVEPFPKYDPFKYPLYGWRWGTRGSVTSAAIEKPHHSGWRPILECDFDLAYSPLLELNFGRGRVTLCTLDLEGREDPAAQQLTRQILTYVSAAPLQPRVPKTTLLGSEEEQKFLKNIGLIFERSETLPEPPNLAVIGASASVTDGDLRAFLKQGGRALVLGAPEVPQAEAPTKAGVLLKVGQKFTGAKSVPNWPEAAGLSLSDLRNRGDYDTTLLVERQPELETAADGLLGRRVLGSGVAIFSQIMPEHLDAGQRQWLRFTRWRQIRATTQLLANLGASFEADARFFRPKLQTLGLAGEWHYVTRDLQPGAASPDGRQAYAPISPATLATVGSVPEGALPITMPTAIPELEKQDGEVVLYRRLTLPADWANKVAILELGIIDDFDEVFVNGKSVGKTTDSQKEPWTFKRRYRVSTGILKAGENLVCVRVQDVYGGGGLSSTAPDLTLKLIATEKAVSFYDSDYREDFELGDEPYRYYRW